MKIKSVVNNQEYASYIRDVIKHLEHKLFERNETQLHLTNLVNSYQESFSRYTRELLTKDSISRIESNIITMYRPKQSWFKRVILRKTVKDVKIARLEHLTVNEIIKQIDKTFSDISPYTVYHNWYPEWINKVLLNTTYSSIKRTAKSIVEINDKIEHNKEQYEATQNSIDSFKKILDSLELIIGDSI
jgi:hypothetical protein